MWLDHGEIVGLDDEFQWPRLALEQAGNLLLVELHGPSEDLFAGMEVSCMKGPSMEGPCMECRQRMHNETNERNCGQKHMLCMQVQAKAIITPRPTLIIPTGLCRTLGL